MYWSARPFVRIVIFFIAGIYSGYAIPFISKVSPGIWFFCVVVFLILAFLLLPSKSSFINRKLKGPVWALLIYLTGIYLTSLHLPQHNVQTKEGVFKAVVLSQPQYKNGVVKFPVRLSSVVDTVKSRSFKSLLFVKGKELDHFKYGDEFLLSARLTPPQKPTNPEVFDYRSFLKYKGVFYTAFADKKNLKILGYHAVNPVKAFALELRSKLLEALRNNGITGDEFSVAAAIMLGYDDVMDDAIRENYQKAGAMHVLCVSGLHVGIVYLVMNFLLGFLNGKKKLRWLKSLLLLLIVWFYAFLTGLSPSVLRATVMISFFIVSNEVERDKDAYNTLAMSAFFLLAFNPGYLFDVGFQLSYAAVLGIITFYRPIDRLLKLKSYWLKKVWSVIAVSLAAQLGTFPLAAHYFHLFPTYFLLTNLIVFPFSFLVITGGLLFMIVSWIPGLSLIVGKLLSGIIYLMNYLVSFVSDLPFSAIKDLYFPWEKVLIVYAIIWISFVWWKDPKKSHVFYFLFMILVFVSFETVRRYKILNQKKVVIYDLGYKGNAIDFIWSSRHLLLTDLPEENFDQLDYYVNNYRIKLGLSRAYETFEEIKTTQQNQVMVVQDFMNFSGLTVFRPALEYIVTDQKMEIDILWLTKYVQQPIGELLKMFKVRELVIIGSDLSQKKVAKIKKDLDDFHIPYYDMSTSGYYKLDLSDF